MKYIHRSLLLTTLFIALTSVVFSQEKEIKIGSHVLTQTGDNPLCYKNGPYIYEKVMDVPGVDKKELYARVKKWMIATMKLTKESIFFDDENNNSISATSVIILDDLRTALTSQRIEFKLVVSFKDNKIKMEANSFVYRAVSPGGGALLQKSFHDFGSKIRDSDVQTIYDQFDDNFVAFRKAMLAAAKSATTNDW